MRSGLLLGLAVARRWAALDLFFSSLFLFALGRGFVDVEDQLGPPSRLGWFSVELLGQFGFATEASLLYRASVWRLLSPEGRAHATPENKGRVRGATR